MIFKDLVTFLTGKKEKQAKLKFVIITTSSNRFTNKHHLNNKASINNPF